MPNSSQTDHRPTPDALLEEARKERRGRLKIFLGAAPGVGKTYEMLMAARRHQADGDDVVIGVVETHGRRATAALIEGLELIPRRQVPYKGRTLDEMDLDALLRRRPKLALVDELAHSNAEGSRHPKRFQDVEELLAAGIDVYATLNIQHIESLNDVVASITHVRVRETVPDSVFDTADEVEVVDLTPQELIKRLNEGEVYAETQARRALQNYFKEGNLTALRELALRRTAQRVDDQMRQYMRQHAIRGPWAAGERVLVCINESPGAAKLIRRAKQVADRLHATWFAIYVETARTYQLSETQHDRVAETLRLAESLGGETRTVPGSRHIANDVLSFGHDNNVTQIIVGKSHRPWWFEWLHGSVVHDLVKAHSDINIHVLAEDAVTAVEPDPDELLEGAAPVATAAVPQRGNATRSLREQLPDFVATALMVVLATLLGRGLTALTAIPNVSLVYLIAVLWSATRYGLSASIFAAVTSTLSYNFFFIEPIYTFTVADPSQLLALVFFCVVAVLTSTLTVRERLHAMNARDQTRTMSELFAFSRKLAGIRKLDTLAAATAAQIANMLRVDAVLMLPDTKTGQLVQLASAPAGRVLDETDLAAAVWCRDNNRPTGRGTDTLPGAKRLFLPLRTGHGRVGVIGVSRDGPSFLLTPAERRLLDALADLATIATERIRLAKDVDQARMLAETEKLRGSLLTSISHDLRTPLASIIGSLASLRSFGQRYDAATRDEMLGDAQDEAERLNRYVGNLLDMTRLDAGALEPHTEPCELRDLISTALRRTQAQLEQHHVEVRIPGDFPLLLLDAVLMEQVLTNLLDNAAKYTPSGSHIDVCAVRHKFSLVISVSDDGPGIPEADLQRIFDKFYRVRENADRSRSGTGLGLAICRGFVEAMGGRIHARSRKHNDDATSGTEFIIEFSPEVASELPKSDKAAATG